MAEEKRGVTALRRAVLPLLFSEWWGSHHLDLEVCQNGWYPLSPLSRGRLFSSVQSHRDYRSPRSPLRGSLLRGSLLRGSLLRGSLWCLLAIYEYFSFFFYKWSKYLHNGLNKRKQNRFYMSSAGELWGVYASIKGQMLHSSPKSVLVESCTEDNVWLRLFLFVLYIDIYGLWYLLKIYFYKCEH